MRASHTGGVFIPTASLRETLATRSDLAKSPRRLISREFFRRRWCIESCPRRIAPIGGDRAREFAPSSQLDNARLLPRFHFVEEPTNVFAYGRKSTAGEIVE